MRNQIRAVGIVVKGDTVLLIHRKNERDYYVFPGGGVENDETVQQAVARELREEASTKVVIKKLLYHHHIIGDQNDSDQYFYLCDYISGSLKLGNYNELKDMKSGKDFYEPLWFPTQQMTEILLYPLEIRDWLIKDLKTGFNDKPREATFKIAELRQSL